MERKPPTRTTPQRQRTFPSGFLAIATGKLLVTPEIQTSRCNARLADARRHGTLQHWAHAARLACTHYPCRNTVLRSIASTRHGRAYARSSTVAARAHRLLPDLVLHEDMY